MTLSLPPAAERNIVPAARFHAPRGGKWASSNKAAASFDPSVAGRFQTSVESPLTPSRFWPLVLEPCVTEAVSTVIAPVASRVVPTKCPEAIAPLSVISAAGQDRGDGADQIGYLMAKHRDSYDANQGHARDNQGVLDKTLALTITNKLRSFHSFLSLYKKGNRGTVTGETKFRLCVAIRAGFTDSNAGRQPACEHR